MNDLFNDLIIKTSKGKCKRGKTCSKCGKFKPLWAFSKDKSIKDGFRTSCKVCDAKIQHNIRLKMVYVTPPDYKQCSDCGRIKPISDFGKDKTKKDGHRSYCKECLNIRSVRYKKAKTSFRKSNV